MTREDIIRMAREAGFNVEQGYLLRITGIDEDLERFAALVASAAQAKEREACAKLCEQDDSMRWSGAADAIRARAREKV